MATGGFSTKNASVGQFDSAYIDVVIILFMYLAGVNFALHFRMLRGERITVWKDTELRVYTAIVLLSSALIFFALWSPAASALGQHGLGYDHAAEALRHATFQAVAIITTTGFGTADYVLWSPLAIGIIFALFFVGGMAGSTGGGLKVVRQILLFKNSFKEIRQLLHPHGVLPIRLNGRVVSAEVMRNVLSFVVLYFGLIGMGTLALAAMGIDLLTSLSAAFSAVGNVGPGFGLVGPAETYAPLPGAAKWLLTFLMMAGRLEIFTVLLFFSPDFWRR
jgi:trk system potassium uptake protein TrkH